LTCEGSCATIRETRATSPAHVARVIALSGAAMPYRNSGRRNLDTTRLSPATPESDGGFLILCVAAEARGSKNNVSTTLEVQLVSGLLLEHKGKFRRRPLISSGTGQSFNFPAYNGANCLTILRVSWYSMEMYRGNRCQVNLKVPLCQPSTSRQGRSRALTKKLPVRTDARTVSEPHQRANIQAATQGYFNTVVDIPSPSIMRASSSPCVCSWGVGCVYTLQTLLSRL
jgi:hypothetical protein